MKKFFTAILSMILCVLAVFGSACSDKKESGYSFMVPDGAPALAVSKLIYDKDNLGTAKTIKYSVIQSTQVQPNLSSGKPDFIVAPVNLASKLYKANSNDYVMVAVITHGNFYILSTTEISVSDLKGKQVAVPNQGAVPDWTFKMVLEKHNISYTDGADKVNINFQNNGSIIVQLIMSGSETIGLVPEPAASALEANYFNKTGKNLYRLDLQELYDSETKAYPQAVLMVKKSVISANPDIVSTLQNKITASVSWLNQNVTVAVDTINDNGGSTLNANTLTANAISGCKMYWEDAQSSKTSVKNYINKIVEIDNKKASAVSDDFFYLAQ